MLLANINVSKTKEMMTIDSRRYPRVSSTLLINNPAAERERQYKYLSTGIVDKVTVELQSDSLPTRMMHIYRRLPSFNVGNTLWRRLFFACLSSDGLYQRLFRKREAEVEW